MRMLTYFINRGGKGLTASRRRELEKAKTLLARRVAQAKQPPGTSTEQPLRVGRIMMAWFSKSLPRETLIKCSLSTGSIDKVVPA